MFDCYSEFDNLLLDDDSNNISIISNDDDFKNFQRQYEKNFKYDNYDDYKKIEENQTKIETQSSFTTDAGLSTTSPAEINSRTFLSNTRM